MYGSIVSVCYVGADKEVLAQSEYPAGAVPPIPAVGHTVNMKGGGKMQVVGVECWPWETAHEHVVEVSLSPLRPTGVTGELKESLTSGFVNHPIN